MGVLCLKINQSSQVLTYLYYFFLTVNILLRNILKFRFHKSKGKYYGTNVEHRCPTQISCNLTAVVHMEPVAIWNLPTRKIPDG